MWVKRHVEVSCNEELYFGKVKREESRCREIMSTARLRKTVPETDTGR